MSATKKGHSHDKVVTPFSDMEIATPNHPEWNRMKFPHRLFHLLNFMENEGLAHMAHWDGQGVCFRIRKSEELVNKVLPFFFQQRKWKSLQRQMNIYSFKRISSGASKGFYFHPFFQRSDISLAHKILRKKQKSELSSSTLLTFQEGSCDEISPSSFTSFVVDSPVIKDDNIDPRPIQFLAPTAAIDTPLSTTPNFQDEKMHGTGISFCDDSSCEQKGASFSRDRYSLSYASAIGRNDLKSGQNMNFVVSPACYLTMFAKYNWGCIMHGAQLAKEGGELDENDNDSVATIDDLSYLM